MYGHLLYLRCCRQATTASVAHREAHGERTNRMLFEQHYLDCLSQASYVIADESTKRAVVVDPRRDVSPYLETAEEHGLTIELVLETHFHADFLSGHLELAAATGAEIGYGDVAVTEFESRALPTASDTASVTSPSRSVTPRATRPNRSRSWSTSTPTTRRRTPCSPATPCSSATSAVPTCFVDRCHRRRTRRPALRLAPRAAAHPARRNPGLPCARRRFRLRQEPLDRYVVDHR